MNSWIFDLGDIILNDIENHVRKELERKFPDLFFTTTDFNQDDPMFPTVVYTELQSVEQGMTLTNDGVNAVLYSVQIDVYTNTKQQDAKRVMASVVDALKELQFTIFAMPEFEHTDVYRCTLRARRMIGANDII